MNVERKVTSLTGKTVVITGGTGSFGKAMISHLLSREVNEIRVFSRDEEKQHHMRIELAGAPVKYYLGDVREKKSLAGVMRNADFVLHAAALKQVPSCEFFPWEAVETNINGSKNVLEVAVDEGIKSVVCLGTDKAVMPVNAMGMTKALMEKTAQALSRDLADSNTVISCVRCGNVMCSRGSVIPLFVSQALADSPFTVTDPAMTRFLMPLSAAVELVEYALLNAQQGDLFVKKAPGATMKTLTEAVAQLIGVDPKYKTIGIRHGEKPYETLVSVEELRRSVDMGDYFRIPMDGRDLNYDQYFREGSDEEVGPEYNSNTTYQLTAGELTKILADLPEIKEQLRGANFDGH